MFLQRKNETKIEICQDDRGKRTQQYVLRWHGKLSRDATVHAQSQEDADRSDKR